MVRTVDGGVIRFQNIAVGVLLSDLIKLLILCFLDLIDHINVAVEIAKVGIEVAKIFIFILAKVDGMVFAVRFISFFLEKANVEVFRLGSGHVRACRVVNR